MSMLQAMLSWKTSISSATSQAQANLASAAEFTKEKVSDVTWSISSHLDKLNKWAATSRMGKTFAFKERRTWLTGEIRAGTITFFMVAYILAVNPQILGTTGGNCNPEELCTTESYAQLGPQCIYNDVNPNGQQCLEELKLNLITATAASSCISCFVIGYFANLPLALAPGMGINAYVAYQVVGPLGQGGLTYSQVMAAIFVEGWIFILLSLTGIRGGIIRYMPSNVSFACSVGIGLLLAFTGLRNLGVVVFDPYTLVALGGCTDAHREYVYTSDLSALTNATVNSSSFTEGAVYSCDSGQMRSATMWLGISGGIMTSILLARHVKGALFIGIAFVTIISWIPGHGASYLGADSVIPGGEQRLDTFKQVVAAPSLSQTGLSWDWSAFGSSHLWLALFTFLYIDLLDCTGTLLSMASLLDDVMREDAADAGTLETQKPFLSETKEFQGQMWAFLADGVGIVSGSMMGVTPLTVYIESAAGIEDGGRTGFTAIVVSFFFFVSLFFSPILASIPPYATGPALVLVGLYLIAHVDRIMWDEPRQAIPAFITIIIMPFTLSVAYGIIAGLATYVLLNVPIRIWQELTIYLNHRKLERTLAQDEELPPPPPASESSTGGAGTGDLRRRRRQGGGAIPRKAFGSNYSDKMQRTESYAGSDDGQISVRSFRSLESQGLEQFDRMMSMNTSGGYTVGSVGGYSGGGGGGGIGRPTTSPMAMHRGGGGINGFNSNHRGLVRSQSHHTGMYISHSADREGPLGSSLNAAPSRYNNYNNNVNDARWQPPPYRPNSSAATAATTSQSYGGGGGHSSRGNSANLKRLSAVSLASDQGLKRLSAMSLTKDHTKIHSTGKPGSGGGVASAGGSGSLAATTSRQLYTGGSPRTQSRQQQKVSGSGPPKRALGRSRTFSDFSSTDVEITLGGGGGHTNSTFKMFPDVASGSSYDPNAALGGFKLFGDVSMTSTDIGSNSGALTSGGGGFSGGGDGGGSGFRLFGDVQPMALEEDRDKEFKLFGDVEPLSLDQEPDTATFNTSGGGIGGSGGGSGGFKLFGDVAPMALEPEPTTTTTPPPPSASSRNESAGSGFRLFGDVEPLPLDAEEEPPPQQQQVEHAAAVPVLLASPITSPSGTTTTRAGSIGRTNLARTSITLQPLTSPTEDSTITSTSPFLPQATTPATITSSGSLPAGGLSLALHPTPDNTNSRNNSTNLTDLEQQQDLLPRPLTTATSSPSSSRPGTPTRAGGGGATERSAMGDKGKSGNSSASSLHNVATLEFGMAPLQDPSNPIPVGIEPQLPAIQELVGSKDSRASSALTASGSVSSPQKLMAAGVSGSSSVLLAGGGSSDIGGGGGLKRVPSQAALRLKNLFSVDVDAEEGGEGGGKEREERPHSSSSR